MHIHMGKLGASKCNSVSLAKFANGKVTESN